MHDFDNIVFNIFYLKLFILRLYDWVHTVAKSVYIAWKTIKYVFNCIIMLCGKMGMFW